MLTQKLPRFSLSLKMLAALAATTSLLGVAQAGDTDVSQTPLVTASGTPVKPNLMFILDDSGSMGLSYLPEAVGSLGVRNGTAYGEANTSQCNGLSYNPSTTYAPPSDSTGNPLANASISYAVSDASAATSSRVAVTVPNPVTVIGSGPITVTVSGSWPGYNNGDAVTLYSNTDRLRWMIGTVTGSNSGARTVQVNITGGSTSTGTLDTPYLGKGQPNFNTYYQYSGSRPRLSYSYTNSGSLVTSNNTFFSECNSRIGSTPGSNVFTEVKVTLGEAQNFANWYKYYRTRLDMMKTVVSQSFKGLDDKYRIGFTVISNKEARESGKDFLHVRDFDATQKYKFYDDLSSATNGGWTPLRGALSNAGRYYANKAPSQDKDPMQYSCQKNFTILATDGAWNTNNETTTYGPFALDGSKVGQQDGTAARPMKDGAADPNVGPSIDSLADVAMYYYSTDLRTSDLGNCTGSISGVDVCLNSPANVGKGRDTATWQRMVTYTMSLGQNGTLPYVDNYETAPTGTYANLLSGTAQWPVPNNDPTKVDDLWHAAVNGRGTFFNAADPVQVAAGLKNALDKIQEIIASGSAAATSTLRPVEGDNQVFIARYTSGRWTGDVRAYKIDPKTGQPIVVTNPDDRSKDNADWSAADKLKTKGTRKILFVAADKTLMEFQYSNLSASQKSLFDNRCSTAPKLTQCAALDATQLSSANSGSNLVNYLRGTDLTGIYRSRDSLLGDMVGSSPAYVGKPPLKYTDSGYAAYQSSQSTRRPMVYVGANDGMLHALDAKTGEELWAYIPTQVLGNLYKLADQNYETNHQYFVDGSPVVADVQNGAGQWRTILVGGLGAGGAGYFALDITDPVNPKSLWEFTHANLGLSFAAPLVTKIPSRGWTVAVTSGYNNKGDGKGYLYLLDALGGPSVAFKAIGTGVGDTTTPSGLGPVNAWVESSDDNTAKRFYAGDNLGNIWRFDPAAASGFKLAQLVRAGKTQPITTQPQLAEVNYKGFKTPVVYVGTGRLLGLSDVGNLEVQSVYGIKDDLAGPGLGDVRGSGSLVQQTLTTNGAVRTASGNPVDWTLKNGWYVDLPDAGERINIDMLLQFNTLTAASNVPQSVASCNSGGGYSWLYYFDIANGSNTGEHVASLVGDAMVVGLSSFVLADGKNGVIVNKSVKDPESKMVPTPSVAIGQGRRTSWRELVDH